MSRKTRDGVLMSKLVRTLESIPGVSIRTGTRYPLIAKMEGYEKACPIGPTVSARWDVVSWMRDVTGATDTQKLYGLLRKGRKYNPEVSYG